MQEPKGRVMASKRPSVQDHVSDQWLSGFVGRDEEIGQFAASLRLTASDPRRRALFNIYGEAGVGKTGLVTYLRHVACTQFQALSASVDEAENVIAAMSDIADQLRQAGHPLRKFERRLNAHRKARHKLESGAPAELASAVTKTLVVAGLAALSRAPVVGQAVAVVPKEVKDLLPDDADKVRAYIADKIRDRATLELIRDPVKQLTPHFLTSLASAAKGWPIALFFDSFERSQFLEPWLLDMIKATYGPLPEPAVLVISGRQPLNQIRWGQYFNSIKSFRVRPFTVTESRDFLAVRGITDEHVIDRLITLGRGNPMLLTIAAMGAPNVPDTHDEAIFIAEQILQAVPDPARHDIVVTAALPRYLNEDVLGVQAPSQDAVELFKWLRSLWFVNQHTNCWTYHDIIRLPMLRYHRARSPRRWRDSHKSLADYYSDRAGEEAQDASHSWENERWIDLACESRYHLLCANPVGELRNALAEAVKAAEVGLATVLQWIRLLYDAGRDSDSDEVSRWANALFAAVNQGGRPYLSYLIDRAELDESTLGLAYEMRGECYWAAAEYELALDDLNQAIRRNPDSSFAVARRGLTYLALADFPAAAESFDRACTLDRASSLLVEGRALAYQMAGRHQDAADDFTRAIDLSPGFPRFHAGRALSLHACGRYDEAIADYTRAIKIMPDLAWGYAGRGISYYASGCQNEAIADLTDAIGNDPGLAWWARAGLGLSYHAAGRYNEAVAAYTTVIEAGLGQARSAPGRSLAAQVLACRARAHHAADRIADAITDYDRAIDLDPHFAWAFAHRGDAYQAIASSERAVADYTMALKLDPDYAWALARRGDAYRMMAVEDESAADYTRAIADYSEALRLDPHDAETMVFRGQAHLALGNVTEAIADLDKAISLDPTILWARALLDDLTQGG